MANVFYLYYGTHIYVANNILIINGVFNITMFITVVCLPNLANS